MIYRTTHLGKRFFKHVTHHTVLRSLCARKVRRQGSVRASSVKVVCVNNRKRLFYYIASRKHCLRSSPRLNTSLGNGIAARKIVKLLESVFYLNFILKALSYGLSENVKIFFLDNEDYLVKSADDGIVNRKVDYKLTVIGDRVELLEPPVARAHPRSKNKKCHFPLLNNNNISLIIIPFYDSN